jgi:hypothetical protein
MLSWIRVTAPIPKLKTRLSAGLYLPVLGDRNCIGNPFILADANVHNASVNCKNLQARIKIFQNKKCQKRKGRSFPKTQKIPQETFAYPGFERWRRLYRSRKMLMAPGNGF